MLFEEKGSKSNKSTCPQGATRKEPQGDCTLFKKEREIDKGEVCGAGRGEESLWKEKKMHGLIVNISHSNLRVCNNLWFDLSR